jgi:hypothetical protein
LRTQTSPLTESLQPAITGDYRSSTRSRMSQRNHHVMVQLN